MVFLLVSFFIFIFPSSETSEISNKIDISRIVGGEDINITQAPYQLSLEHMGPARYYSVCGATIIGSSWAITAAHCVVKVSTAFVRLRSGISHLNETGGVHEVEHFEIHPTYERKPHKSDIALIKIVNQFEFSDSVQPIKLAETSPSPGTIAVVTGWGMLAQEGRKSLQLQEVAVYIFSSTECSKNYGDKFSDGMLCAGHIQGGKDACQGDSGGPLAAHGMLLGVVSWGEGCAQPEFPGVYSDVAYFRPWIISVTGDL